MRRLFLPLSLLLVVLLFSGCGNSSQPSSEGPLDSGIRITLKVAGNPDPQLIEDAIPTIQKRLDALGTIPYYVAGQDQSIIIEIRKEADAPHVADVLAKSGELQFREVLEVLQPGDSGYASTAFTVVDPGNIDSYESLRSEKIVLPYRDDRGNDEKLSLGPTRLDGSIIASADSSVDSSRAGDYKIDFELTDAATPKFGQLTTELLNKQLAIVLGYAVISFPTINEPITDGAGEISGAFTEQETRDIASILNSGSLDIRFDQNPVIEEF